MPQTEHKAPMIRNSNFQDGRLPLMFPILKGGQLVTIKPGYNLDLLTHIPANHPMRCRTRWLCTYHLVNVLP